ncbi:hypothetical protein [Microbacterium sp.]|uniref:hypothetical protein n=1 Tax=Microbacterium sp. TaxID=51671 RepID=UPI0028A1CACE|nr:hypothetical protein [Microbacterium sp.]
MDTGAFLLVLLLPFGLGLFVAAVALLHGASAGINAVLVSMKDRVSISCRSRRERAFVRRHQRDTSRAGRF